jgi:hypothetical protein
MVPAPIARQELTNGHPAEGFCAEWHLSIKVLETTATLNVRLIKEGYVNCRIKPSKIG